MIYTIVDELRARADRIQYYGDSSLSLDEIHELANELEREDESMHDDCFSEHTVEELVEESKEDYAKEQNKELHARISDLEADIEVYRRKFGQDAIDEFPLSVEEARSRFRVIS